MTFRFAHKYGEKLIPILEELVKVGGPNKSDAAKIASLQSILDALKLPAAFNPLAKTQLAKFLGKHACHMSRASWVTMLPSTLL